MSLPNIGCPKCYGEKCFCTWLDDGQDGYDDDKSSSDDTVDKGDDLCQYNDHQGRTVMKDAVALLCN